MKKFVGRVISDKMQKTVVVKVERRVKHPIYEKRYRVYKKYHADNLLGAKTSDYVVIAESRPLSKTKKWKVVEILGKKKESIKSKMEAKR